jgi:hypothetical protein
MMTGDGRRLDWLGKRDKNRKNKESEEMLI